MSNGMRVDLSAMDEVIKKLWGLLDDMDKADNKAKYETHIPASAFGHPEFMEAVELCGAHGTMKDDLEKVIKELHKLINKFGTSTSKVKDKYHNQEYSIEEGMGGGSGGPKKKSFS